MRREQPFGRSLPWRQSLHLYHATCQLLYTVPGIRLAIDLASLKSILLTRNKAMRRTDGFFGYANVYDETASSIAGRVDAKVTDHLWLHL
jgi:hypothetical protein